MIQNVNKYHIYEILSADGNTIKTSSREYSWEQMCDRFAIDEKGNHLVKGFQRHILKEDE